jgi:hypothetical protein
MQTIEEHLKTAQFIMRETANRFDNYDGHNEPGRRYLLESALTSASDIYQQIFAAKVKYNNQTTAAEAGRD